MSKVPYDRADAQRRRDGTWRSRRDWVSTNYPQDWDARCWHQAGRRPLS